MDRVTQLLDELYINGFAVMEDAIPIPTIERIHAEFLPMLEHVRHREHELGRDESGDIRVGCGHLQHPNRYTLHWPWEGGLACREIAENPTLLALLEAYWETDDFLVSCLHSNTPYPGSTHQNWHRDIKLMAPHVAMTKVPHLGVKFPLVDTSVENGSFEVLPSTQFLSDPHLEGDYNDIVESGSYPHRTRVNMKRGTLWVQDPRALHRGTPNRSDGPMPHGRSW
jgi:ectoine hydroxylase-related dioxygenase (phytanoyl-CoA dioxygenase family)